MEIYDDIGMYTTCIPFGDQRKSSGQIWKAYSVVALEEVYQRKMTGVPLEGIYPIIARLV